MKSILPIILFFFSFISTAQQVKEYQWKNRLVVLVSEKSNATKVKQQLELLNQNNEELQNRDIVVLKRKPNSQDLSQFSIDSTFQGVLLIGKDGGLKLKKSFVVKPQVIFDLVDSMPMRQAEIRRNKGY